MPIPKIVFQGSFSRLRYEKYNTVGPLMTQYASSALPCWNHRLSTETVIILLLLESASKFMVPALIVFSPRKCLLTLSLHPAVELSVPPWYFHSPCFPPIILYIAQSWKSSFPTDLSPNNAIHPQRYYSPMSFCTSVHDCPSFLPGKFLFTLETSFSGSPSLGTSFWPSPRKENNSLLWAKGSLPSQSWGIGGTKALLARTHWGFT